MTKPEPVGIRMIACDMACEQCIAGTEAHGPYPFWSDKKGRSGHAGSATWRYLRSDEEHLHRLDVRDLPERCVSSGPDLNGAATQGITEGEDYLDGLTTERQWYRHAMKLLSGGPRVNRGEFRGRLVEDLARYEMSLRIPEDAERTGTATNARALAYLGEVCIWHARRRIIELVDSGWMRSAERLPAAKELEVLGEVRILFREKREEIAHLRTASREQYKRNLAKLRVHGLEALPGSVLQHYRRLNTLSRRRDHERSYRLRHSPPEGRAALREKIEAAFEEERRGLEKEIGPVVEQIKLSLGI